MRNFEKSLYDRLPHSLFLLYQINYSMPMKLRSRQLHHLQFFPELYYRSSSSDYLAILKAPTLVERYISVSAAWTLRPQGSSSNHPWKAFFSQKPQDANTS